MYDYIGVNESYYITILEAEMNTEARTNKIINMVQLLGNCSNQSLYEYTNKDVDKIFKAIQTELDEAKKRFSKQDSQKGSKFTLD